MTTRKSASRKSSPLAVAGGETPTRTQTEQLISAAITTSVPPLIDAKLKFQPIITSVVNTNAPSFSTTTSTTPPGDLLTYLGTKPGDLVNVQGSGAYGAKWKGGGTAAYSTSAWGIQFRPVNSQYAEFMVAPVGAGASVRIFVDDVESQLLPTTFPGFSANVFNTFRIDFGPAPRKLAPVVKVMFSANMLLARVWVQDGGTILPAPTGAQVFLLGDSLTNGETQNTGDDLGSYVGYLHKLLRTGDIWNGGVRGTGPNTVSSPFGNYKTRATEDIPATANIVIINGFFNDRSAGRTAAQMAADFGTTIDNVKAKAPTARIVVVGSPDPTGGSNATEWATFDTAIQATCQSKSVPYVSASTGRISAANGVTLATMGGWISPGTVAWAVGNDGLHPTDAGHQIIAARMADALEILGYIAGNDDPQAVVDVALAAYKSANPARWASEVIVNSSALVTGYNDNAGGVLVDYDVVLTQASFRLADPAAVIGGTGNLQIQWYAGSPTASETTLIATTQIAAGQHDVIVTFATPVDLAINTVLRAKITMGSTTVAGPCHVQWRGRYK